jgi:hypothetical protein
MEPPAPPTVLGRLSKLRWMLVSGVLALVGFSAAWLWASGPPEQDPAQRWRSPIYITTAGEKGMKASFRVEVFKFTVHKEVGTPQRIERAWNEESGKWSAGLPLAFGVAGALLGAVAGVFARLVCARIASRRDSSSLPG